MSIQTTRVKGDPDRVIGRRPAVVDAVLAVGNHVFSLPTDQGAMSALVDDLSAGGTANILQTQDGRPLADITTAGAFNADVPNSPWFLGAVALGFSGLVGATTAVQIVVATQPVHVIIRPRQKGLGSHGA